MRELPLPRVPEPPLRGRAVAGLVLGPHLSAVDAVAEVPLLAGADSLPAVAAVNLPPADEQVELRPASSMRSVVIGGGRRHRSERSEIRLDPAPFSGVRIGERNEEGGCP